MKWSHINDLVKREIFSLYFQGCNPVQFGTDILVRAQPLPQISDPTTINVYVDSATNTVHQIQSK